MSEKKTGHVDSYQLSWTEGGKRREREQDNVDKYFVGSAINIISLHLINLLIINKTE